MASEVERFASRLSELLFNQYRPTSCNEYVHVNGLRACIEEAMHPTGPVDVEYPKMLYRNAENCTVHDRIGEAAAREEGFGDTPPPQFEPGFPRWFRERDICHGGSKCPSADIRRVQLNTSAELRKFEANTDSSQWMNDESNTPYGGRNVNLSEILEDRKRLLCGLVDQEVDGASGAVEE